MNAPDTRLSLIARLGDARDAGAWAEFVSLYRPVVMAMARSSGLQDADAEDLTQQVMLRVAGAVERFEPTPDGARFRSWLRTIARRTIINHVTRRRTKRANWSQLDDECLGDESLGDDTISEAMVLEFRRQVFRVAARMIRGQFQDHTWQAFWWTAVDGRPVKEVADQLGCTTAVVHSARSRVLSRLRQCVATVDPDVDWDADHDLDPSVDHDADHPSVQQSDANEMNGTGSSSETPLPRNRP